MADVVRVITRKNSLRTVLRELSIDQIDKLLADLNEIYEDIYKIKKAEDQAEESRQKKIIELKALMIQEGIDLTDIVRSTSLTVKKKVKPKY